MIRGSFRGPLGGFAVDAAFSVPGHGITGVFGPSGAGKTTLLRCIAGLDRLPGELEVEGECWQDARRFVPAHRRAVGFVFQQALLLPHLSVARNLAFGLKRAPESRSFVLDQVVAALGLAPLLDRRPQRLSGGEAQRVAIGRALLRQPRVLLMDEPLSALDAPARAEVSAYLEPLLRDLELPVFYVSHDAADLARVANRVLHMKGGRIVEPATGAPGTPELVPDAERDRVARLALAALAAGLEPL